MEKSKLGWLTGLRKSEIIAHLIFSLLVAATIVLGAHIVITASAYSGTVGQNYIEPYSWFDLFAYAGITLLLFVVLIRLYAAMKALQKESFAIKDHLVFGGYRFTPVAKRALVVIAAVIFIAWVPYLLIYWPGFVFGDSISSLRQIAGFDVLNNHHPVAFTLFLKQCIKVAGFLGLGTTAGCALFCLIQMGVMAIAFSYFISWLHARFGLHRIVCLVVLAILAFTPYVATYSIALWKDPLFSIAVLLLTLQLVDVAFSGFVEEVMTPGSFARFVVLALAMSLLRNNGIFIVATLLVAFAVCAAIYAVKRKAAACKGSIRIAVATLAALVVVAAITGPLYSAWGVAPTEKAESLGVPLNQMARVAALDGNMSESDYEYMNSLLPIGQYREKYRPCCTDLLKIDQEFNDAALGDGFWIHWLSMLVKNPGIYFEAWELQTFGFWTFNVPVVVSYDYNIASGNPHYDEDVAYLGITTANLLGDDGLKQVFPYSGHSIPEGLLFWLVVYLGICAVLYNRKTMLLVLLPSIALMGTLIIASPIWYWPRYGAALQFLTPLFIVLFLALALKGKAAEKGDCQ